jgi:hypothetical protein
MLSKTSLLHALLFFMPFAIFSQTNESEPNDLISQANAVSFGTIEGRIDSVQDVDYFAITVSEPGVLSFLMAPPSEVRPQLDLFFHRSKHKY